MPTHSFALQWYAAFGDALPAGFLCRRALADRWLRVHSLPLSKRYAEIEAERSELLHRQNAVASYVLGEGADCVAFVTRFGQSTDCALPEGLPLGLPEPECVLSVNDDDNEIHIFALPVVWHEDSFNEIILAAADDRTGPLLFANLQRGSAYAPYDGGADLFFPSTNAASSARARFRPWLSTREDGL
ncbi:hypothetical protein JWH04_12760 [Xanthomonas melonis]|uniref:DUF3885 domain-containing protein n=1 Tax=Xanthomonas melonis TaxID=56456 RepID=UPI001E439F67|nr:hypothetical protein [Xanthomonas melonis]MCD0245873.1 hypothetical protein [Xanthomonas melonis]MCD0279799.1 hypothetical protein [Xanthomonas melonis]